MVPRYDEQAVRSLGGIQYKPAHASFCLSSRRALKTRRSAHLAARPASCSMGTKALTLAVLGEASYGNFVRSYGIGNHVDLCGLPGAGIGHRLERALHEFEVGAPS